MRVLALLTLVSVSVGLVLTAATPQQTGVANQKKHGRSKSAAIIKAGSLIKPAAAATTTTKKPTTTTTKKPTTTTTKKPTTTTTKKPTTTTTKKPTTTTTKKYTSTTTPKPISSTSQTSTASKGSPTLFSDPPNKPDPTVIIATHPTIPPLSDISTDPSVTPILIVDPTDPIDPPLPPESTKQPITSSTTAGSTACVPSVTVSKRLNRQFCSGELIFEDTFDSLDLKKWQHEVTMAGGGNNEFQVYWNNSKNSYVTDGNLNIAIGKLSDVYSEEFLTSGTLDLGPSCTASWNNGCKRMGSASAMLPPMTSARLHTVNSFSFLYGKVEVRAKMPAGDWLWPAIWMMPWKSTYGYWPVSGEIDILESKGNRDLRLSNGGQVGVEQALATMHWGPSGALNRFRKTAWYKNRPTSDGFDKAFHLFGLEWTPESISFSIDGEKVGTVTPPAGGFWELGNFTEGTPNPWVNGTNLKMTPFDHEFFLILNVAVGGTSGYFPDVSTKPWKNSEPATAFSNFWTGRAQWEPTWLMDGSANMLVDYVRVWAL